ncbi:type I restriction endonuclease subunit S [Ruminococcus sp. AM27-27]|uniref:restriction endonuclease subunit S n=1 Tax=Mediterraneibacter TaxID=2316020 RepID=UPI000E4E66E8|nr:MULTISPECIES: restriction endonuclease subunit S [Mediterraneibacter]RGH91169.1 type I restriction endonuclease subunit S [Ruminococcus sp. AM27-27]
MAKLIDITGKSLSGEWGTDDETGDGIPVLRTTNFTNEGVVNYNDVVTRTITKKNIADKFLRKGDIIIEKSGGSDKFPVGRVIYFDGEEKTYLFNNFTGLLRVKNQDEWYPKYIFYSLYANYKRGGTRAFENKTTGLHNLKTDDYVSRYEVAEIDKTEQILICEKLNKLYEIIKLRRQELQLLDELIKARFVELFGDPIKNPKGWEVVTIGDIVTEVRYGTSKPAVEGGKYPYLRMNNLTVDGHLDLKDLKYIDIPDDEMEKCVVRKGDVLFNRTNSIELVGKTAVFDLPEDMVIAGYIIRVRLNERLLPEIFSQYMNLEALKDILRAMAKGAVNQANINAQELQSIKVYVPDMEVQKQFIKMKEQVDKSKVAIQAALDKSQLLFDSLMQKYFG